MTNNRKSELAKKAIEIDKRETKEFLVRLSIIALISFTGGIIAIFVSCNSIPTAFNRAIAVLLILMTVLCAFTAICFFLKHKFFIKLVNAHEFEIVEKDHDGTPWYCIHLVDTNEYYRAEIIEEG